MSSHPKILHQDIDYEFINDLIEAAVYDAFFAYNKPSDNDIDYDYIESLIEQEVYDAFFTCQSQRYLIVFSNRF